jgi:hypothetical protein
LTQDEITEKLKPFLPLRVVLHVEGGTIRGLVEHSFSMNTDPKRVLIFWSGKAYSILGECTIDAVEDAAGNCKTEEGQVVFDPLSPDCPIEINWEHWLTAFLGEGSKFNKRNAPFTPRPLGTFVIRALLAEQALVR